MKNAKEGTVVVSAWMQCRNGDRLGEPWLAWLPGCEPLLLSPFWKGRWRARVAFGQAGAYGHHTNSVTCDTIRGWCMKSSTCCRLALLAPTRGMEPARLAVATSEYLHIASQGLLVV